MDTNTKKTFCVNCGAEVSGKFCPNCGTSVNAYIQPAPQLQADARIIHENANVQGRYNVGVLILAAYFGFCTLFAFLIAIIPILVLTGDQILDFGIYSAIIIVTFIVIALICVGVIILSYLPGYQMIRKRSPEGTAKKTFRSFLGKSIWFFFAWSITLVGCTFIVGILLRVWRIGLAASRPKDNEYTAFVGDKKIAVTRLIDKEYSIFGKPRYIYVDQNGEFYRPPLY